MRTLPSDAIFTLDAKRQDAILNQHTSVNSTSDPSVVGTYVAISGTSEGQTDPTGVDGKIASGVYAKPMLSASLTIGGIDAPIAICERSAVRCRERILT